MIACSPSTVPEIEAADENLGFLEWVAAIFAELKRPWIVRVDGEGDPDAVAARVRAAVGVRA